MDKIQKRPDGFGINIFQQEQLWTYVCICPHCSFNDLERNFGSQQEASDLMETAIALHKQSGECSHDWVGERISDSHIRS